MQSLNNVTLDKFIHGSDNSVLYIYLRYVVMYYVRSCTYACVIKILLLYKNKKCTVALHTYAYSALYYV